MTASQAAIYLLELYRPLSSVSTYLLIPSLTNYLLVLDGSTPSRPYPSRPQNSSGTRTRDRKHGGGWLSTKSHDESQQEIVRSDDAPGKLSQSKDEEMNWASIELTARENNPPEPNPKHGSKPSFENEGWAGMEFSSCRSMTRTHTHKSPPLPLPPSTEDRSWSEPRWKAFAFRKWSSLTRLRTLSS